MADRLTAAKVKAETKSGFHRDGDTPGLYLQIARGGSKSWAYRFQLNGKPRWMGLGPVDAVSLAEAREAAREARRARLAGIDPIEQRRRSVAAGRAAADEPRSFKTVAEEYIASHRAGWRSPKSEAAWAGTLAAYAYPVIGSLDVAAVETWHVTQVLKPIWETKPETAGRVRGRIEAILSYAAVVLKWHSYNNPAAWRGHLDVILPAQSKVRRVKHHAALPYRDLPAFMGALREQPGTAAWALQFAILTAARTGEVLGACWREFDSDQRLWVVPGERMKSGREHRVPLSDEALALLGNRRGKHGDRVWPLSNMSMLMLLRRMGRPDLTVHGFRSAFSDWCTEQTDFPAEAREMALAHAVGDKVEAAYRRGDLLERRVRLMDEWSRFVTSSATDV